jgi:hypothetical protein
MRILALAILIVYSKITLSQVVFASDSCHSSLSYVEPTGRIDSITIYFEDGFRNNLVELSYNDSLVFKERISSYLSLGSTLKLITVRNENKNSNIEIFNEETNCLSIIDLSLGYKYVRIYRSITGVLSMIYTNNEPKGYE